MTFKSRIRRVCAAASILTGLAVLFAAHRAETATLASCKVPVVSFYRFHPQLIISCPDPFITFTLFVNPDSGAGLAPCGADLGAVKAMESLAIAARVAGAPLNIYYTDVVCNSLTFHVPTAINL